MEALKNEKERSKIVIKKAKIIDEALKNISKKAINEINIQKSAVKMLKEDNVMLRLIHRML